MTEPDTRSCPEHGNWIAAADVDRLVREIDVALNGEAGAAKQASLCDIAGQVRRVARDIGAPILSLAPHETFVENTFLRRKPEHAVGWIDSIGEMHWKTPAEYFGFPDDVESAWTKAHGCWVVRAFTRSEDCKG